MENGQIDKVYFLEDSDTAQEYYAFLLERYNNGTRKERLYAMYEEAKKESCFDACDYEMCVTAHILAFWEIGLITQQMIDDLKAVVDREALSKYLQEECGGEAGKEHRDQLGKLLVQISQPNPNPRKRQRPPKIAALFSVGDILSFRCVDGTYGGAVVLSIERMAGFCLYGICRTNLSSPDQPSIEEVVTEGFVLANKVPSGNGDEDGMALLPWYNEILHEDLKTFTDRFTIIGRVKVKKKYGQSSITNSFDDFLDDTPIKQQIKYYNSLGDKVKRYPLNEFVEIL